MINTNIVTKVFLLFLATKSLVESYLDARNKKHILENQGAVPEKFADKISLEEHQKAASYSVTKINTAKFFQFYDIIILLVWTLFGGLDSLDYIARGFELSPLLTGVISKPQTVGLTLPKLKKKEEPQSMTLPKLKKV